MGLTNVYACSQEKTACSTYLGALRKNEGVAQGCPLSPRREPGKRPRAMHPDAWHMEPVAHGERERERRSSRVGSIEVVCGSMFSGKTEELLRRVKRARLARQNVLLFKPRIDNRYDDVRVVSHDGLKAEATAVASSVELLSFINWASCPDVVGIDEAQFFDADIVDATERLANEGVRVICAGLDQDYRGRPFGPMPSLMSIAEYVTKLHAVCSRCGASACRSQRLIGTEGQLFVGGSADYEPRCRRCFVARVVDAPSPPPTR
jgi:thymidine kinase